MKKFTKKLVSLALVAALLTSFMSFCIAVNAAEDEKVKVIVRNNVFSCDDGAAWDGVLVDEWIDIDENTTMMSAVVAALDNYGYSQSGAENNYITEINGLSASDGGWMGGWMGTLNDWFTNQSFDAYTVADGTLENGDEICIMYSLAWGEDVGGSWSNTDVYLSDISFSSGTLSEEFDPSINDYVLTIPSDTESILVTPTAYNKYYQVRTYLNNYTPEENGTEYKRNSYISVADGDKIIVGVGDEAWESMNYTSGANVYTFTIAVEKDINELVEEKINSTSDYLLTLSTPYVGSIGGEWLLLGLARNSSVSDEFVEGYYNNVVEYVNSIGSSQLDDTRSTENSRVILGLTSIGKDVTNVDGYNLLEPLADFDFVIKQGINGPVWALIAIDSNNYEIPLDSTVAEQTTRELLIETILSLSLDDGGWTFYGDTADPDMTGMAIQALAKYYGKNDEVTSAVDKAVNVLSEMQDDDGGYASWGSVNVESCAQVAVALTSIGIDPSTDERFIKNGNSLIEAIMSFSVENGFEHTKGGNYNQMATEQAFYSLVSYKRFINGQTSLYDMTDVFENSYLQYDVNLDGYITIDDVTLIQKHIAGMAELNDVQTDIADCDGNGSVTIDDATLVQKYIAGLI